jgi:hypothetical protein
MLKVEVNTVNGGAMDWPVPDSILDKLARLRRDGLEGRDLVHELLTDDWGAPPRGVSITGTTDDGRSINEYIPYSKRATGR